MVLPHTNPGLPVKRRSPPQRHVTNDSPPAPKPSRDVIWDRPLFHPPDISNWRVIFDPTPFRHQDYRQPPH